MNMNMMGNSPGIMVCPDGYLVGRLEAGERRSGFKGRKIVTS